MGTPIALSDTDLRAVMAAAAGVPYAHRAAFLEQLASVMRAGGRGGVGELAHLVAERFTAKRAFVAGDTARETTAA